MTDRWQKEAERLLTSAVNMDMAQCAEALATALSAAHEAGRLEEREACAQVADSERAVWGGDFSIVAFSARKTAEDIATAIRSREGKP